MNRFCSSNQPTTTLSQLQPVSLKEWTSHVVEGLKSRGQISIEKIVCSPQYLACAFKIAHSLANQMSAVEDERGYKEMMINAQRIDNNSFPCVAIETLEKSWSEYVSVYCVAKVQEGEKGRVNVNVNNNDSEQNFLDFDLGNPLPYCDTDFDNVDFQYLERQLSTLLCEDNNNNNDQLIDHFDVRGAILNEGAVNERPLSNNGKVEIRLLGIAFYELFSGGQLEVEAGGSQQPLSPVIPISQSANYGLGGSDGLSSSNECKYNYVGKSKGDDIDVFGNFEINTCKRRAQMDNSLEPTVLSRSSSRSRYAATSIEPLKSLGLPNALCDLIDNMINCVDGGTNGNKGSYNLVSDVAEDLKCMIDSPHLYLHDFDLRKASNTGLQFEGSLYGREVELQTLKESYERAISNEFEAAMICGTSGIGKSELSREFARSIIGNSGCTFLSGRFDKLQSQPLYAISSAFDSYCAALSAGDQSMAEKVSSALRENMGEEMASLVTALPSLKGIIDGDVATKEVDTAVDAQKRLCYLFCRFVQIISECHEKPLVLFLDDCQWIDSASAGLLGQLMMSISTLKYQRFFFIMSCRDDELSETHPLNVVLSSVSNFGIKTTKIHLAPLSKSALNKMVSATLSLLPRITRPLADILHHKTKGGPLFAKQLMMELYKQRLLYPSLSLRRWVWETDKIVDMKIPENVATFITKSINRLPPEVLSALMALSCFGASADISLIEVLEREIKQPLIDPLEAAVTESVLEKKNGKFYFMHDKLQEAAYSMMKPNERCLYHNLYGQALGFVVTRENDDSLLLTAATQINFGGPQAVIDDNQAVSVAKLNLDAGKKAMKMSDFFAAHSFFNHGISYLRIGHWVEQYGLSLELFNLAAVCALMNAEHERVRMLTGEIVLNAKSIEDKFGAICISITLLLWSSKLPEAMEAINTSLIAFEEELPLTNFNVIEYQFNDTKKLLDGLSDEILLSYPIMKVSSKIMAMELFSKQFVNYTFAGKGDLMPIIPLKMVQTSLLHGMSPFSGIGFALYGNYLALVRGEVEEGYRFVKLALALNKRYPSPLHDSEILYYSAHTKLRVEPMQSSIEHYSAAYRAAMSTGLARFAFGCSFLFLNCSFWSGKKLDLVINSMKVTMKQMIFYKNFVMLALLQPIYRVSSRLMSRSDEHQRDRLTNIFGETYNERDVSKLPIIILTTCFVNFYEGVLFRDIEKARNSLHKYISMQSLVAGNMSNPSDFFRIFYAGLASLWVGRELDKKELIQRGVECEGKISKLATSASVWNFENKSYLLQAEKHFSLRNFEEAERMYEAAISSSKAHKFVNEEALANELAGRFYVETGRVDKAVSYFLQASENYKEWGADVKASSLLTEVTNADNPG